MNEQISNDILHLDHKECVKCEGRFQRGEQIRLDINNYSYCTACYEEVWGGRE